MANVVGRIPVGADTRPLERDIQASLNKNFQLKGLNEKSFTQPLGRITGSVDEFRKSLDASNARVLAFGASAGAIFAVQKGFENLIRTTISVQKNLTDINAILGLSSKNLQAFGDQLFKVASQTGQSFDVVSQAAAEFSRQGLGVEETLKRTRDALILTRLSGLDVVKSTEALTATINSFNKVALDSTTIVNKLATVDAAFAVSSADLAEAIQRVGSSAESVGLNLDQLVALVTSVQQTTARGGSVIGNSLKTIFTRLERTEVLDQLEQLGLEVRNLDGSFRPAIDTLSQLATRFDGLSDSQKANVAELVGGVFQINILKAALGDLGKQYSIYNNALNTSTGATDAAIKRNEQLNQTLSALINRSLANFTRLSAEVGDITVAPALEKLLSNVNSLLESFSLADAKGPGEKIAKGFLEGLGNYISGPGLALIGAVIGKLFINLAKFSAQAVGQVLEVNKASQQQAEIQQRINSILAQNPNLVQGILNKEISLLQVEQEILGVIKQQTIAREQSARISSVISTNLIGKGVTSVGGKISAKSKGFIPNFASPEMAEIYGAYLGGYKPGKISSTNIPGEGKVIYNKAEQVKKFPGMAQPAIIPPKESSAGKRYKQAFEDKLGFNPYASAGYIPNFESLNELIRQNKNKLIRIGDSQNFKIGQTGKTARESVIQRALENENKSTSVLDARGIATMLVPREGFTNSQGRYTYEKGPNAGTTVIWPVKTYNKKYRNEGSISNITDSIENSIGFATASYAESIKPPAERPDPKKIVEAIKRTPGARGAVQAAAGGAFEVGLGLALGIKAASAEGLEFDVLSPNAELRKLFGYSTPLADFKINDSSPANRSSMADKIIRASGTLGEKIFKTTEGLDKEGIAKEKTMRQGAVASYLKANLRSQGYIPNYSALSDSIRREISAGVSPGSIKVGQDSRLRNSQNPLGLGVYNTKDEPKGLPEGINNFKNLHEARKAGAARGFIPNFAQFTFNPGSLGEIDTRVANQEIRQKLIAIKQRLAIQEISIQQANIEADKVAKEYGATAKSAKRISNIATIGARENFGKKIKNFVNSPAGLGASIALPVLGGAISSILPEEATTTRSAISGVTNTASFALTGAQLGGAPGAAIGTLVGGLVSLLDIAKNQSDKPFIALQKQIELSQEKLNKLNDSFSRFNSISEKLNQAYVGSIRLSSAELSKLQSEQVALLSDVPAVAREQILKAFSTGDFGKIQEIQTQVIRSEQGVKGATEIERTLKERERAVNPSILDLIANPSRAIANMSNANLRDMYAQYGISPELQSFTPVTTPEQDQAYQEAIKSFKNLPLLNENKDTVTEYILKQTKGLETISPEVESKIKNGIKAYLPKNLLSYSESLLESLDIPGLTSIANKREQIANQNEERVKRVREFAKQFLDSTNESFANVNTIFSRGETEIANVTARIQSRKGTLLDLTKQLFGEFTQLDISSQYDEAIRNAEAERARLSALSKIGGVIKGAGTKSFEEFRGLSTVSPELNTFIEDIGSNLQRLQEVTDPEQLKIELQKLGNLYADQAVELKNKIPQAASAAENLSQTLLGISRKELVDYKNEIYSINETLRTQKEIAEEEIAVRRKLIRLQQGISFAGGIQAFQQNAFQERTRQFNLNRVDLGSTDLATRGRGALGILDELKQIGIGPRNLPEDLKNAVREGLTADLRKFLSSIGQSTSEDNLRKIADLQLKNYTQEDQAFGIDIPNISEAVENIYKELRDQGVNISSGSISQLAQAISGKPVGEPATTTGLPTTPTGAIISNSAYSLPGGAGGTFGTALSSREYRSTKLGNLASKETGDLSDVQSRSLDKISAQEALIKNTSDYLTSIKDIETQRVTLINEIEQRYKQIAKVLSDSGQGERLANEYRSNALSILNDKNLNALQIQEKLEITGQRYLQLLERQLKYRQDEIERMQDLKDLADGYLSSVEFANKELERQQNLARQPGYNPLQGVAINFTNQMAYNGTQFFQDLNTSAVSVAQNIQDAFSNAFQSFANGTQTAGDAFNNFAIQILQQIQQISTQIATKLFFGALFNPLQGALSGGGGGGGFLGGLLGFSKGGLVKGYSSGGRVSGGGGVADDVPAVLSKGEYVLNKRAVKSIEQAYGSGFLESLNLKTVRKFQDGGFAFQQNLANDFKVTGFENTEGLNTKNIGQGISALKTYMDQMRGEMNVDSRLSNFALTDPNQLKNAERMQTQQDYFDYVNYLNDVLNQNIYTEAQAKYQYQLQLDAYNRQQKQSGQAAWLTAGMAILGGGLMQFGGLGGLGGLFGGGGGGGGFGGASLGGSTGFGASFGIGSAGTAVSSASMGTTAAAGGLGSLFGAGGSNLAMLGLVGAGAVGSPFLISMLKGGTGTQRNTISPNKSSSGLTVSNRWRFAGGGRAQDNIPALLMDGEYVINKDTVDKYGIDFFERINKGAIPRFAEGGPVGESNSFTPRMSSETNILTLASSIDNLISTMESQPLKEASGDINNNINISINIQDSEIANENRSESTDESGQNKDDDNKTANQRAKALTDLIKDNVVKVIIEQKRPGGLLAKTG